MKQALFIVNPISGGKSKQKFLAYLNSSKFNNINPTILMWAVSDDWKNISEKIKNSNYDIYVAVGGDGTVNLVARSLLNSNKSLGIIPFGSGNGLARHLNIPMNPFEALNKLDSNYHLLTIDSGMVNEYNFFCTSGFGFDAMVANAFAKLKSRGLWGYASTTIKLMAGYKSPKYNVIGEGINVNDNFYLLSVANANQFGNEVKIAPTASLTDGQLNFVGVQHASLPRLVSIAISLLLGKILKSKKVVHQPTNSLLISSDTPFYFHLDGEPMKKINKAEVTILPKSLLVAV